MIERFKTFTVLITKINRCIHKIKTEEMAEFQLKSPHVSCLYYLYKSGALTSKQLCEICAEDKAALSRSVDYLEKTGFIVEKDGDKKRYKTPLCLTEKGEKTGKRIAEKIDGLLMQINEGMTEEERAIMYETLTITCNNLEKICNNYGEKNGNKIDD